MLKNFKLKSLAGLSLIALSPSIYAIEPPFIVEQKTTDFVEEKKPQVDLPEQQSLSTSSQEGVIHVEHVQFQGGTVFELTQLAEKVKPIIDKDASKTDLVNVLRSITSLYQEAGYPLSFAFLPNQDTVDGSLTIVLVEGYVARSEIVIEDEDVRHRVEKLAAKMHNEIPLKTATFERYLSFIEATPGHTFKVNVPKPKTVNGATTIRVEEVKSQPYDVSIGFNESEEEDFQLLAGISVNSLTSHADKLTFTSLVPNGSVDAYYAANYEWDVGTEGLKFEVGATHFDSQDDDRTFFFGVPTNYEQNKKRTSYNAGFKYPVIASKRTNWWVGSRLRHINEDVSVDYDSILTIKQDLSYSAIDLHTQWQTVSKNQLFYFTAVMKQGIDLGSNKNEYSSSATNTKVGGPESTNFNAVDANVAWRYLISPKWRFQTKANAFWSDDILPSAEQVRYGGVRFGRGYPDGQAQGDRGYAGEVELRYIKPVAGNLIRRIEPYIVFDAAKAELQSSDADYELSSAAVGVDISDARHYTVGLEYAKPTGDAHYETDDRSAIYNIRLNWNF